MLSSYLFFPKFRTSSRSGIGSLYRHPARQSFVVTIFNLSISLAAPGLSRGTQDLLLRCMGLCSCDTGPECMALEAPVVVASELSCSEAYGILVFRPRIELRTPALEGRFLHLTTKKILPSSIQSFFNNNKIASLPEYVKSILWLEGQT